MKYKITLEVDDNESDGTNTKEDLEQIWISEIIPSADYNIQAEKATVELEKV